MRFGTVASHSAHVVSPLSLRWLLRRFVQQTWHHDVLFSIVSAGVQCLHAYRSRPCSQMLAPPHSTQRSLRLPCAQMFEPPHSTQRSLRFPCSHFARGLVLVGADSDIFSGGADFDFFYCLFIFCRSTSVCQHTNFRNRGGFKLMLFFSWQKKLSHDSKTRFKNTIQKHDSKTRLDDWTLNHLSV